MADPIVIGGMVISRLVILVAKYFVIFLKKKYQAADNSPSLADVHEVLNKGLRRLCALRKDKENEVLIHIERNDPNEVYKDWKKNVSEIKEKVTALNKEYKEVKKKKWDLGQQTKLLEKMKKALSDVIELLGDPCLKNILAKKLPQRVIKERSVQSIKAYPTLKKALDETRDQLKKGSVNCVALSGQKGVGKTTIMQHLNNRFYYSFDNKDFDMVIFIKVADDERTDRQILCKIADRIMVGRAGTSDEVAGRIQRVLEKKRYLLILDGLAHTLDGIWQKLDLSDHKKGSKVVIASHYRLAVISTCVNRVVKLNKLPDTEAHKMFLKTVGKYLPQAEARQICDRFCCCLPLLIYPIAMSFKHPRASSIDWQEDRDKWTRWPQVKFKGVKKLYSNLKNCYQRLLDQSEQKCFLYASLYPANSKIYTRHFVECCIVQELLGKTGATAKYSGMRSRAIKGTLKHLVNDAFLEEGEGMRYVKMNDLYRQFALHILSDDSNSEFKTYVDDGEAITSASCQRPKWLSMVGSKKDSLPANQKFSRLQALLLQKNLKLAEISNLSSMRNLLVLNLHGTKISKLSYLSKLAELKALYLNGCSDLKIELHHIESFKYLQVLDIRGTRINSVPHLKTLWCLRMSYAESGDYRRISKLKNLEELTIEVKAPERWCKAAERIVEKVASLKNLTTLRCSFCSSKSLEEFKKTSKSWRSKMQSLHFEFFVGCKDSKHSKKSWSRLRFGSQ